MKVYFIYADKEKLPKDIYNNTILKKIENDKYVLYAYTDNKKLKNKFIQERINIFYVIEKEMTKEEYDSIKEELVCFELKYRVYKNYAYQTKILSIYAEYENCHSFWTDIFAHELNQEYYFGIEIANALNDNNLNIIVKTGIISAIISQEDDDYEYYTTMLDFNPNEGILYGIYGKCVEFTLSAKEINLFTHYYKKLFKQK